MSSPLDLFAEVTTANGTAYRFGANQPAANRLTNLSFSTKIGEGFSTASGTLARRIDLDYPDLNLVDNITLVGADGSVAWEGRLSAMPRELGDAHSIGLTWTGWMAHAKDRKFSEIYVDRDQGAWGDMSAKRRAALLGAGAAQLNAPEVKSDATDSSSTVVTRITGAWAAGYLPFAEAWYDAGGARVGKITYSWKRETPATIDPAAAWTWTVAVSSDNAASSVLNAGNLKAAGPTTNATFDPAASYRWAFLQFNFGTSPAGLDSAEYGLAWSKLAVYGDHGLTTQAGEPGEPDGVYASDVIANIANRWCPELNTGGVQSTGYVIQHLAFKDPVFPFDAFLEVNKYHLWQLAVWENKTLHFEPYDLTDYDWEIRTDDQGTTFAPQGPSVDDLFNGVAVTYTDALTGLKTRLTPDDFADLGSTDETNPWNAHGVPHWEEIELSTPTIQAQALQLGRAALADRNTPKTPGTITVKGYIRDRQGHEQPAWKVRAGDTISVTNFPNDTPRLIVETSYDDESKTLTMSIDRPFALLDAYLDRVGTALQARGLA